MYFVYLDSSNNRRLMYNSHTSAYRKELCLEHPKAKRWANRLAETWVSPRFWVVIGKEVHQDPLNRDENGGDRVPVESGGRARLPF